MYQGYGHQHHMDPYGGVGMNLHMIGGSSMKNTPFIREGVYSFIGQSTAFEIRSNDQTIEENKMNTIRDAVISLQGTQVSQFGMCCFIWTIVWGSILIFPLFFMCCDWWKRIVYPSFSVSYSAYGAIRNIVKISSLQNLTLTVTDNTFDQQKINLLYEIISTSNLKAFTFINLAGMYDYSSANQYSEFFNRMKAFKKLPIITDLRWSYEIVV